MSPSLSITSEWHLVHHNSQHMSLSESGPCHDFWSLHTAGPYHCLYKEPQVTARDITIATIGQSVSSSSEFCRPFTTAATCHHQDLVLHLKSWQRTFCDTVSVGPIILTIIVYTVVALCHRVNPSVTPSKLLPVLNASSSWAHYEVQLQCFGIIFFFSFGLLYFGKLY